MIVRELITRFTHPRVRGTLNQNVVGLTHNSRNAGPGIVFVALPEEQRANPYQAIAAAERGAAAVICPPGVPLPERGTCITVSDPSEAYALAAAELFERPADHLQVISVRGPRSATIAGLLQQLLRSSGSPCGLLSSRGCEIGDRQLPQPIARLEAVSVQEALRNLVRGGAKSCIIESSRETDAARNLAGVKIAATLEIEPTPSIASGRASELVAGNLRASDVVLTPASTHFNVAASRGRLVVRSPLVGRSTARDLLYAIRAALHLGIEPAQINKAVTRLKPIPGSLVPVRNGQPYAVFIDEARTGESLTITLTDAGEITREKVRVVLGGSADHTTAERTALGHTVGALADHVIVTSDNPRELDAAALARDVLHGAHATAGCSSGVELNRARAIQRAFREARPGDTVVIAGKGHRRTQEIEGSVIPFDDVVVARESLAERGFIGSEI